MLVHMSQGPITRWYPPGLKENSLKKVLRAVGRMDRMKAKCSNCRCKAMNQWGPDVENDTETLGQNPEKDR